MTKVLIIGRNGQLTKYLQEALDGDYVLHVSSREELDLTASSSIQPFLEALSPSVIINPAAYTSVDEAEQNAELAFAINRDAVREIAQYSVNSNTPLIHFSTDYVFSGDAHTAYLEQDSTAPTGVYGESKLGGDQAILESGAPAIILRTAWVYSNRGNNFYKTMLSLAQTHSELSIVNDQIGSPTYAGSIATATKKILAQIVKQGGITSSQSGVYHCTNQGQASWYEFAQEIFSLNKYDQVRVNGIPSRDYPTPAKRPAFSVLDGRKLHSVFGIQLPEWKDALNECVEQSTLINTPN